MDEDNLFPETDDSLSVPTKTIPAKTAATASLKLPVYAWFLIIGGAIIVVVLAIVLPLILIKPSTIPPAPPATATPSSVPSENYPPINPQAITYQTLVPPLSGIMKNAATISNTNSTNKTTSFLLSGRNSSSAIFIAHFDTGTINLPANLGSTGWSTVQDISTQLVIGYDQGTSSWKGWTSSGSSSAITWSNPTILDNEFFVSPIWAASPGNVIASFQKVNSQYEMTVQSESAVFNLATVIPGLLTPLNSSIICLLSTSNESYLTVAIPQYFTNQIVYLTYTDTTTIPPVQILSIPNLVYADMSSNGLWLLVLTTQELELYSRPNSTAVFALSDIVALNSRVSPQVCALDRTSPTEMWCCVGTTLKYAIIVSVDTNTGKFNVSTGRQLTSKFLQSTDGLPMALTYIPSVSSVFLLMGDNLGNVENVVFQQALI